MDQTRESRPTPGSKQCLPPKQGRVEDPHTASACAESLKALLKTIHDYKNRMRAIDRERNVARSQAGEERAAIKRKPDTIRNIEKEIARLTAELRSGRLQTGPGSDWIKTQEGLTKAVAKCEHDTKMLERRLALEAEQHRNKLETLNVKLADLAAGLQRDLEARREELHRDFATLQNKLETDAKRLQAELAPLRNAIEAAENDIARGTVEINGRSFIAADHIRDMKLRERTLYDQVVARHPLYAWFLEWLYGEDPEDASRKRLERDIVAVEREYANQTQNKRNRLNACEQAHAKKRKQIDDELASHERQRIARGKSIEDELTRLELSHAARAQQATQELAAFKKKFSAQAAETNKGLATLAAKRNELLEQLAEHEAAFQAIVDEKSRLQQLLSASQAELASAEQAHSQHADTLLADLDHRQASLDAQRAARAASEHNKGNQRRTAALQAAEAVIAPFRQRQPPLAELRSTHLRFADRHPADLCLGWLLVHDQTHWECWFPAALQFPIPKAIWLTAGDSDARTKTQSLLVRLMTALPPNGLTISVIDPLQLGASLGPLRRLLKRPGPFFGRNVCTLADEIETSLREENDHLEELVQETLGDGSDTWGDYNAKHPRTPLQYRVVVYYDAPEQLTDKSTVFLQRLVELGPARGILPVVITSDSVAADRRGAPLHRSLTEKALRLSDAVDLAFAGGCAMVAGVASAEKLPDELPSREQLEQVLDEVSGAYGAAMNKTPSIEELWGDSALWAHSATDGLIIPIGWSRDGVPVSLELGRPGGTGIHTLVAGRPGSGKSSLLHVLLHSLCHRYSPAEVRVMLLDYKQGVEMAMYASPVLPHADLVAIDSDVSYGVTVLEHLKDEIERRAKLFQEAKKTSLDQYNRCGDARDRLPRILLLIDEFQVLFAEDRATTTDVESLLIALLRQGRAYGIHVLLCTQTLSGLTNISLNQLTALIAERICLACDSQDSAKTLSSGNEAGAQLTGPPEAILNSANGSEGANRLFVFPEPIVPLCQRHLAALSKNAADTGHTVSAQLFRGDEAIPLPSLDFFESTIRPHAKSVAIIGHALSFKAGPVIAELPARLGGHVLLVGPTAEVREGILLALLRSLACQTTSLELKVYNARENPRWQSDDLGIAHATRLSNIPADWNGDFTSLPELPPSSAGVLVIDGLDQDRLLKSAAVRLRPTTPSPSPAITVMEFMEMAHKKGWRVIATADNWRRLDTPERKDLLNEFQIRIGFQMSDDDASRMTFNAARAFGISGGQDRAVYFDQLANHLERFRPFVVKN